MLELLEKNLKKYLNLSLSLVYPLECLVCRKEMGPSLPAGLCYSCLSRVEAYPAAPMPLPAEDKFYFKTAWAACRYEGVLKEAIHLLKYRGKLALTGQLSQIMISYASKNIGLNAVDGLMPVPLNRARLKEREFNQSEILAAKIAGHFALPLLANSLIRIRPTLPQADLTREERQKNVNNAFALRKNSLIKGKNILLIDDVFTTGATLNQCARILKETGQAREVNVFVLAKG